MKVLVNGEAQELEDGATLQKLVNELALPNERIAVELNLEVVRRAAWSETRLKANDKIEIVHFVGGGSV